ncbi:mediator of RNA polymerase II transcription subunit 24 isoform X1 [Stomoxys calcitrans]|uniref:mediator of RNA polymerase II transcription subunit 24 isoform X1 n=1 Tax=Stomoxys calcitrans TaxID=35570 RepID=UPI0027E269D6|nr:mediator of RNA polymerase II transcription subunit 24 isoform X1 [Stomoxys calcitrans]
MKENKIIKLIHVAWRERWTDSQWGINIKNVIPRGAGGDAYNLSDCILQQALIGSTANPMVLNYLKHSLCAHLVSYAAVLRRISKYDHFDRIYCLTSLLDFVDSILDGVTCRTKVEESILPGAIVSLVDWLMQIFATITTSYEMNRELSAEQSYLHDQCCTVIEKLVRNQFILAILYVGRQEDPDNYSKIRENYATIKTSLTNSNFTPSHPNVEKYLQKLAYIDVHHLDMKTLDVHPLPEPISYCVQPLLAVEVLLNPCNDTSYYVAEMQMLQRLKKFSNTRLFYEIIRAGFVSLSNVAETSHDTMLGAFTFFKVPQIIKQLHALNRAPTEPTPTDFIPEVVEAFEMLLEDNLLLDLMDSKCSCNIIDYLLNDWAKQHLVNEVHVKHFAAQRDQEASLLLQKREWGNQTQSIINFIIRAEVPLSGVLKTLSTDYNKVQEALLEVLCTVLVGNSFDLLLSVATVEGRLKTFVSRLIQCNENSKQIPGEVGKSSIIRSTLFDVSFLMLTSIVQTYGSSVVLTDNGDSFFEKWVRECMVERNKPKNPRKMIAICDENIVDEILMTFSKPDAQLKTSNITWQDICINLPGVLYHVLISWEKETLSAADVKNILDNIKRRMFSFSVCATSFLSAYMHSVKDKEVLKPLNMIQQFLTPAGNDEMSSQENVKERLALSFQIIRKMQYYAHPTGSLKSRSLTLTQNLVSRNPLIDQFKDVWSTVADHGWVPPRAAQVIESLLHAAGPAWLASQLVEEMLKCKYKKDMMKTLDIIFAISHLDIERVTEALLTQVVPQIINNRQGDDINEPQSYVLARLCVYCIISALETRTQANFSQKKRSRSHDGEDLELNAAKMRKITGDGSDNSCSNDFLSENSLLLGSNMSSLHSSMRETPTQLREPLQSSIQYIFRVFQQFVTTEELSPKIYFVYQFISLLVECGKERIRPVLKLLPATLMHNLLKVMLTEDINVGLISRLYDLRFNTGRQSAVSDLCLWRNIKLKQQSIQL